MTFGVEQLKDGFKNFIMGQDKTCTMTIQEGSQLVHLGN